VRMQNVSYWCFLVKDASDLSARLVRIAVIVYRRVQRNPYTSVPVIHHDYPTRTITLYDLIAALQSRSDSEDDAYIVALPDYGIDVRCLLWKQETIASYLVTGVTSGDQMAAMTRQEVELLTPLFCGKTKTEHLPRGVRFEEKGCSV
jgi:hypothetical protein